MAVKYFDQIVKQYPQTEWYDLAAVKGGLTCQRNNDPARARQFCELLITGRPNSPLVPDAKAVLGLIR